MKNSFHPSDVRQFDLANRTELEVVVSKISNRNESKWHGYLEANEMLLLLKNGACLQPSLEKEVRESNEDDRPRWYQFTPGKIIRSIASKVAFEPKKGIKPR